MSKLGNLRRARLAMLLGGATAAFATQPGAAQEIAETNRYPMQVMVESFDGAREYSHTQTIGYARQRKGQESWIELDFGDGAVVIESPSGTAASGFRNTSGVEAGMRYDYATRRIDGGSRIVSRFHNTFVRRQLGRGPMLGQDASWTSQMTLAELGFVGRATGKLSIEVSREYFSHAGRDYVLLRYRVPSFSYTRGGRRFVQWGEGVALTDPGFGTMYWNAALHRAVGEQDASSGRPYRYAKTMIALDDQGMPMVDPRAIPQTAALAERFYGEAAHEVMGFVDGRAGDVAPLVLANSLDVMALSIGEDSANQLGEVTGQYLGGDNGNVVAEPLPEVYAGPGARQAGTTLGAQAAASGNDQPVSGQTLPHEAADVVQGNGSATATPEASAGGGGGAAGGGGGSRGGGSGPATPNAQPLPDVYVGPGAQQAGNTLGAQTTASGNAQPASGQALPHEVTDVVQGNGPVTPAPTGSAGGGGGAAGGGSGGGGGSAGGGGSRGGSSGPTTADMLDAASIGGEATNTTLDLSDKFSAISEGLNVLVSQSTSLSSQLESLETQVGTIRAAIAAEPSAFRPSAAYTALKNTYEAQKVELASLEAVFDTAARTNVKPPPGMVANYVRLSGQTMDSASELARLAAAGEAMVAVPTARQLTLAANLQAKAGEISRVEQALAAVGAQAGRLKPLIQSLSETQFASLVKSFGASPYAKVLSGVATGLNVASVGMAAYNTTVAAGTDLANGQDVGLTRNYGSGGSLAILGLEIAAMAGNAYTGNVKGLFYDMAAISVGSVTDIIISAKSVQDANFRAVEAEVDAYNTELRFIRQRVNRIEDTLDALGADIDETREELADFDEDTDAAADLSQRLLDEVRARREARQEAEEAARLAEEEAARAEAEAIALAEAQRTEPTPEEWEQFKEDIAEAIRPDYPTVPAITAEEARAADLARRARREEERRLALEEAEREAAELAEELANAAAEREAQNQRSIENAEAAIARREEERARREDWLERARERELTVSELETSDLDVSSFDVTPVEFEPPTWVPPVFEPPVWVPPTFDPPKPTPIKWTDFDEGDDYPHTGNLAFGFEDMSGTVETDLSRWAEWLATQNVRELTRLALAAGYPNLASALADAENIIRQSQDEGYRRWAMQQPSCGGYVGCGPSFLERWAMKSSIVVLGDILAQSREIFSTGGFSDIGISGSNLSYLLRDHSLEDGDIVQISIAQFGRKVYEGRVVLTNAGETFNLSLRPGVASLVILAENEGFSPPNTAQVALDNVVRGDAVQTYSLTTNQTATLRIETNAGGN